MTPAAISPHQLRDRVPDDGDHPVGERTAIGLIPQVREVGEDHPPAFLDHIVHFDFRRTASTYNGPERKGKMQTLKGKMQTLYGKL